jgi:ribosomal protein S18 acetylase RimI-like enzyme
MSDKLALRPVRPDDEDFLFRTYAGTRADEMALVDWSPEQKQAFLQMQFDAQRRSYQMQFPDAKHDVILHGDASAGRLMVDRSEECILVIDIALLPEHRNSGIGSRLLRELQAEAAASDQPLRMHVENFNRARRLYERLGFTKIDEVGFYWLLEWRAPACHTVTNHD